MLGQGSWTTAVGAAIPFVDDSTASTSELVAQLVIAIGVLLLLVVLLIVDLRYMSSSRRLAKQLGLPKGQWLRPAKTLFFDPAIEVIAVGVLIGQDVVQNWEHLVAGLLGAAIGVAAGHYRYRIQYVGALPEHKAIVFVRSRAEYVALTILLLVDFASEQHQIPVVGPLTLLITIGLTIVLAESISRSWFSFRRYRRDVADAAVQ